MTKTMLWRDWNTFVYVVKRLNKYKQRENEQQYSTVVYIYIKKGVRPRFFQTSIITHHKKIDVISAADFVW